MLLQLVTPEPPQHRRVWLPFKSIFPEARGKTDLKMALVIAFYEKEIPDSFSVLDDPETFSSFFFLTSRVNGHYDTVCQGDSVRIVG